MALTGLCVETEELGVSLFSREAPSARHKLGLSALSVLFQFYPRFSLDSVLFLSSFSLILVQLQALINQL